MIRKATAHWAGGLKDGKGMVTTESGAVSRASVSFATRFEEQGKKGTNPEELVAAAHAACFSMALASLLPDVDTIDTTATVTIEHLPDAGWSIAQIHLDTAVRAKGVDRAAFDKLANEAKLTCPISRLINGTRITMEARLLT